jgi:outer membrane protein assembly factor BamB
VPTIDGKTRAWLNRDLARIPAGTPVFLSLHHPPYGNEFASAEYDTLVDLLRDYNVVLVLYGHGHGVSHREMDGIDGVMGGSTFDKNAGYGVVSVQDGVLRVAYHFQVKPARGDRKPEGPGWRKVLEKPIERRVPNRLFRITTPLPDHLVSASALEVALEFETAADASAEVSFFIDGAATELERVASSREARWRIDASALRPGWHRLTVRAETTDQRSDVRTSTFITGSGPHPIVWRKSFPAAVKAGPVLANDSLVVARTDGVICALDRRDARKLWSFPTGGEILGTPAWSGELLVFGSGDGKVYALDASGKEKWTFDAGLPVYGPPRIEGDTVYVGDNGGRLHALALETGKPRWTFSRADYSIESEPCVWGDLVVFGAWDGYLYAVRRSNGELVWKVLGPKSSDGKGVRYYAPADCGPVALGESLLVCDRGYMLGSYDRAGALGKPLDEGVSGIAADAAGRFAYCRTTGERVSKVGADGDKVWEAAVPAGRFPVPPTCREGAVYVCSNEGLLSVLASADGRILWQYQVTPGFYVMAPVAIDDQGVCYVAGMDGTVTAVRPAP